MFLTNDLNRVAINGHSFKIKLVGLEKSWQVRGKIWQVGEKVGWFRKKVGRLGKTLAGLRKKLAGWGKSWPVESIVGRLG